MRVDVVVAVVVDFCVVDVVVVYCIDDVAVVVVVVVCGRWCCCLC